MVSSLHLAAHRGPPTLLPAKIHQVTQNTPSDVHEHMFRQDGPTFQSHSWQRLQRFSDIKWFKTNASYCRAPPSQFVLVNVWLPIEKPWELTRAEPDWSGERWRLSSPLSVRTWRVLFPIPDKARLSWKQNSHELNSTFRTDRNAKIERQKTIFQGFDGESADFLESISSF